MYVKANLISHKVNEKNIKIYIGRAILYLYS